MCRGWPNCKGELRVDRWMQYRNTSPHKPGGQGCVCGGYWFIHRRGSKFCEQRADKTYRMPGDPDFAER